ncbi:hypothetical protein [Tuwongella immobilis]|uniref:Uncharacterized protein n=1 Tax=Tuwongella immobilis TaxID=692036 RepID=A0A6C2YHR9_9BACT|nr:hypothetical protein [Tuwongella immobilis]VIP01078.1 Uncharacterized protein OS=Lysobacter capsici AZ78 GN=AZ78_04475 PE=4 SV=1 [Tuwongella immobilis]VTR97581.1 Uncharacterized protein OS=Lysobacter capsici AZ78 GN=AZ78_04475 PE=4 SV=1 [Tuwongella immobilis]
MPMTVFSALAASDVHLEVEVAASRIQDFLARYQEITGVTPTRYQTQPNKFGLEGRIYFNGTPEQVAHLQGLGYHVQGPRTSGYLYDQFAYRIDSVELFWVLVNHGFRL